MREFDGKHQSIRLNHWHQSFFRILQIESSRCESHSHTDINSQCPPLLKDSMHSFSGHFFHSVGRIHFESAIPRDTIHYSSIISQHSVSENKSVPLLYTSILEPLLLLFHPSSSLYSGTFPLLCLFTPHSSPTKVINTSSRCGCLVQLF